MITMTTVTRCFQMTEERYKQIDPLSTLPITEKPHINMHNHMVLGMQSIIPR